MRIIYFIFFCFLISVLLKAQDNPEDLLKMVEPLQKKEFTISTFKTTRLVNFHTTEVLNRRSLDFRISHRFGDINSGAYNAWGIDGGANIRLALEYSHDGRFMFGLGRTSSKKIVDGFIKYQLIRQTTDYSMPISLTLFSGAYHTFEIAQISSFNKYQLNVDRISYCNQIMVARKFNSNLSIQLSANIVHFNLVDNLTDDNTVLIAGIVGRYKITPRQAITLEYGYRINKYSSNSYYDSFAIGYDLETGGHVFQVHLTNSFGLTENEYFIYTRTSWLNLGVRLGFNISRGFSLQK